MAQLIWPYLPRKRSRSGNPTRRTSTPSLVVCLLSRGRQRSPSCGFCVNNLRPVDRITALCLREEILQSELLTGRDRLVEAIWAKHCLESREPLLALLAHNGRDRIACIGADRLRGTQPSARTVGCLAAVTRFNRR